MNKIKITSSNNNHVVKDGVLFAKPAGAVPMVGKDNRMYLTYDLGIKLNIPLGVVALILPPNESSKYSVAQSGNFMLLPGEHNQVVIEYKINTDAIPRVFEQDEFCAQIIFVQTAASNGFEFETILEAKEDAAKQVEEKVSDNDIAMGVVDPESSISNEEGNSPKE